MDALTLYLNQDGQSISVRGLLADFLRDKANRYVEPTRAGTPKGESIGLFFVKHVATLLTLTSLDAKDIANRVGVSYGLLRKWRTEPVFRKTVDEHCRAFVDHFFSHIKIRLEAERRDNEALRKLPLAKLAKTQIIGRRSYDEFSDRWLYGDRILEVIWETYLELKTPKNRKIDHPLFQAEVMLVLNFIEEKRGAQDRPFSREELLEFLRGNIDRSVELLTQNKKPTREELTTVIFLLTGTSQALKSLGAEAESPKE